jgi:hypothetical protein
MLEKAESERERESEDVTGVVDLFKDKNFLASKNWLA